MYHRALLGKTANKLEAKMARARALATEARRGNPYRTLNSGRQDTAVLYVALDPEALAYRIPLQSQRCCDV